MKLKDITQCRIPRGVDYRKLLGYAARFSSNTVIQRLGYISEFLNERGLIEIDKKNIIAIDVLMPENAAYTFLGSVSRHSRKGSINARWSIVENIDYGALFR